MRRRLPHLVDVELVRIGLHNEPINLRVLLQQKIDARREVVWLTRPRLWSLWAGDAGLGRQRDPHCDPAFP
ncbi:MAG: hypothetical protein R3E79_38865 [Caldilineaceae bacterium]